MTGRHKKNNKDNIIIKIAVSQNINKQIKSLHLPT